MADRTTQLERRCAALELRLARLEHVLSRVGDEDLAQVASIAAGRAGLAPELRALARVLLLSLEPPLSAEPAPHAPPDGELGSAPHSHDAQEG